MTLRAKIAAIIDPTSMDQWRRWKSHWPHGSFNVPSRCVAEAKADAEKALAKADKILALTANADPRSSHAEGG